MSGWNSYFPKVRIEGPCAACGKPVDRMVSVHTARQTKDISRGGWRCMNILSIRRGRERAARMKACTKKS
jgi:hypothetical protein